MLDSLQYSLIRRRLGGGKSGYASAADMYARRRFIEEMDITTMLGGHSACVNALWYNINFFSPSIAYTTVKMLILVLTSYQLVSVW